MAYVTGFICADGNLVKTNRGTFFVSFYSVDRLLLVEIRGALQSTHKISLRQVKRGSYYRLQIGSKQLFEDLVKLGITPNKARRMKLPNIPKEHIGDFVRGYFDGDGNVWSGRVNIHRKNPTKVITTAFTSASISFLRRLKSTLTEMGLSGGSIYKIPNKNCSRLQYSTLDTLKLYEIMYNRVRSLYLPRKKVIFEKFIKMRP